MIEEKNKSDIMFYDDEDDLNCPYCGYSLFEGECSNCGYSASYRNQTYKTSKQSENNESKRDADPDEELKNALCCIFTFMILAIIFLFINFMSSPY